jgi:hypothetical protein
VTTAARPLRSRPGPDERRAPRHLRSIRLALADGAQTTLHVAAYAAPRTAVRVVRFPGRTQLAPWCIANSVAEALAGGFFELDGGEPLGELRTSGIARASVPFDAPWHELRACVHTRAGRVTIARRPELPAQPRGDLLQAGPLLVRDGRPCTDGDPEGFSAGARQFDSDITAGRHPRAAIGVAQRGRLLAVATEGRSADEAGLTLPELAEALVALGAVHAINLDGGGSTALVCGGVLRNRPREPDGTELDGGRPVPTALLFTRR